MASLLVATSTSLELRTGQLVLDATERRQLFPYMSLANETPAVFLTGICCRHGRGSSDSDSRDEGRSNQATD
jgi:hypothetical protein